MLGAFCRTCRQQPSLPSHHWFRTNKLLEVPKYLSKSVVKMKVHAPIPTFPFLES